MPREITLDGLALRQAYHRLCELTDENSERFNEDIFWQVRRTADGISRWISGRTPEQIWDSTKAYFAIGFCGGVYVGICGHSIDRSKTEPHDDTNLGNDAPILKMALDVFDRVRFCGKPSPEWYESYSHLFKDLNEAVSRKQPKKI